MHCHEKDIFWQITSMICTESVSNSKEKFSTFYVTEATYVWYTLSLQR